jgi:hypothetical protein
MAEAYSFSKVYYEDELGHYDEYRSVKVFELYECIVRMAHFRYIDQDHLSTVDKTEKMLDLLLALIGATRQPATHELDVSSESDYESDD